MSSASSEKIRIVSGLTELSGGRDAMHSTVVERIHTMRPLNVSRGRISFLSDRTAAINRD
jgi:hypothetical protein